ncbi:MAG: hypothetical protein A3I11_06720 [Elusimicrobia bacterium RIFCSPLOWO2_02_FULL_39_32]|nr:MAG: hypothetical protein A3B80_09330 [Elusimicrobia bacterium RIFCSPHIGHO2_02_FULL_39_36]OGR91809.1 MAG: hypothetical protein A3I11_06720 [Elusimicrobia bacterium RIFCSPLOWO2_02_FULL_39_32]OGR98468.1 MAG: hypothetical protein A3G85_02580 [Elusimicrobia bacterium RIFCSPLOWO2_12_FULL_39_28]
MTEQVAQLIKKSEEAIEVSQKLLKDRYFSHAASKAYYSIFYATQALLISRGIEVVKHSAVESSFGYHFARTKEIDPKFHEMLIDARRVREMADYAISDDVIGSVASQKVEDAKEFLKAILPLLEKK